MSYKWIAPKCVHWVLSESIREYANPEADQIWNWIGKNFGDLISITFLWGVI